MNLPDWEVLWALIFNVLNIHNKPCNKVGLNSIKFERENILLITNPNTDNYDWKHYWRHCWQCI